jgi:hypothetical protein
VEYGRLYHGRTPLAKDPYIPIYESQGSRCVVPISELLMIPVSTEAALSVLPDRSLQLQISRLVAKRIVQVQQVTPEYFQEKIRTINLAANQTQLANKLASLLTRNDYDGIKRQLEKLLRKILRPHFFKTEDYQTLLWQIYEAVATPQQLPSFHVPEFALNAIATGESKVTAPEVRSSAIAVLLLDAENINLPEAAESWIAECCQCPIQIKVAFGNWRRLGSRDQELHQRGYQMIHVPRGKNGADFKMTALGAFMFVNNPRVKEVIVCSCDSDLNNLRQVLFAQGLGVYHVSRQHETLTLTNGTSQIPEEFSLTPPIEVPSLSEGLQFLREYLASTTDRVVPYVDVCSTFLQHFRVSLRQFVSHHGYTQSPKSFLENRPEFALLAAEGEQPLRLSLTESPSDAPVAAPIQLTAAEAAREITLQNLEIASCNIMKRLMQVYATDRIRLDLVATHFKRQYGQSMSSILQQHQLGKSLPKAFLYFKGIKVEWNGDHWVVLLVESPLAG